MLLVCTKHFIREVKNRVEKIVDTHRFMEGDVVPTHLDLNRCQKFNCKDPVEWIIKHVSDIKIQIGRQEEDKAEKSNED